ncbi:MAG: AAA family ATPase [Verrucomicrobiota bacterium]
MSPTFPFSAIIGMDLAKTALLLHAVNPRLGGVLLSGHRGSAKTTLARAFGDLLDEAPLMEVPLGATEDRLLGGVDVSSILDQNKWSHQPGLLEQADGGVLYVDEVNLLPDTLSDQLLDAAATGSYRLEREGMSRQIETRFILVGSMNPEEGELRPQLSDRFAHSVEIASNLDAQQRSAVIRQQLEFDSDPDTFVGNCETKQGELRAQIQRARTILNQVKMPDEMMSEIGQRSEELQLEGMRGGLAVARTALAAAAWDERTEVKASDLDLAWQLCLGHRVETPEPPSNPPNESSPKSHPDNPTRSFVSLQPTGAQSDSLPQTVGPSSEENRLSQWLCQSSEPVNEKRHSEATGEGSIDWKTTVLGWIHGIYGRRIWRTRRLRRQRIWLFVDASRSSGAEGFLGRAQAMSAATLQRLVSPATRVEMLHLHEGQLTWDGRNMLPAQASERLRTPRSAAGESFLIKAFSSLLRDVSRKSGGPADRVVIFSDGICTSEPGGSVESVQSAMKRILLRLSRMGPDLLWIAPSPKRGFQHPVATLGLGRVVQAESL